jgi:antimicrobial peptide system SdpA family protein
MFQWMARTDLPSIKAARLCGAIAVAAAWIFVGVLALLNAVADSPVKLSLRSHLNVSAITPEGWAFFTRDPREPQLALLALHEGRWVPVPQQHAARANAFGFARYVRVQMLETSGLLARVSDSEWTPFPAGTDPLALTLRPLWVRNAAPRPRLCGDLLLVEREPVPWAWSTAKPPVRMAGRALRLAVTCGRQGTIIAAAVRHNRPP